jgi:NitT/TauT family transport system permease protein
MPSATSWVITGLKVSVPYPLVGIVIGELMSSNRGAIFNEGLGRLETFFLRWR